MIIQNPNNIIPKQYLKEQPRSYKDLKIGESCYLNPFHMVVDNQGFPWLSINGYITDNKWCEVTLTKTSEGWKVEVSQIPSDFKWEVGEREKRPLTLFEPIKEIIWKNLKQ